MYPVAKPKPATIEMSRQTWIPYCDGAFGLEQAPKGEWWQGMWRFPLEDKDLGTSRPLGAIHHVVTRHRITMQVYLVPTTRQLATLSWFLPTELASLPIPTPFRKALHMALLALKKDE